MPGRGVRRGSREFPLGDEQLVLEPEDERRVLRRALGELGRGAAQVGAQLVVRAERPDPGGILPYAGTAKETGLAAVTGTGV